MSNPDMDGQFLGGGHIDHVVHDGEIYINSLDLATVLRSAGTGLAETALEAHDQVMALQAQVLFVLSFKTAELRSEILKREIEKSL